MVEENNHTFVIAANGDSPYIEECIRFLKSQTLKSKINLVTSTPSPFLEQISANYDIPYIVNSSSKGIASDWSFAYKNCSTRYLTIAHQDDIYMPNYTELCLNAASINQNSLIIFTAYSEMREIKTLLSTVNFFIKKILLTPFLFKNSISSNVIKRGVLSFGNPICCPSVMYNKENIGNLEFSNDFKVSLDWNQWLKLAKQKGSFVYSKKKALIHRIHSQTTSSATIANHKREEEDERIFKTLWPSFLAKVFAKTYNLASKSTLVTKDSK